MTSFLRPKNHFFRLNLIFLLFVSSLIPVFADKNLKAELIIVGPGDPIYTYWGHIGLAIEQTDTGESLFYDFGNFSFYSENFYRDFAMGKMIYLGLKTPTDTFLRYSQMEDRDLTVYPLNLGDNEIQELRRVLRRWVLPENREYLYDYFLNNCSTIIRDILNDSTGGQLKAATENRPDLTFRHYARTGAHESVAAEFLLHFLLGPSSDVPVNKWDMMFLPQRVAEESMKLTYIDSGGIRRTLAGDPFVLKTSTRPPVPDSPKVLWPIAALFGLLLSVLWAFLFRPPQHSGAGRWKHATAGITGTLIILIVGLPGGLLGFLMAFTDHFAAHGNLNLWPAFPTILFALVPLSVFLGRKSSEERRRKAQIVLSWFWTVNLLGLIAAMFLRAAGIVVQDCSAFWAFYAPLTLTASRPGLWLRERRGKRISRAG